MAGEHADVTRRITSARAMERLGAALAPRLGSGMRVHLRGDLGAGKTTLVRGALRALGHTGAVRSPTFTLVESYALDSLTVIHCDLYRLAAAAELESLGARDFLDGSALCFVEWAERGEGYLTAPDVDIEILHDNGARRVRLRGCSPAGSAVVAALA